MTTGETPQVVAQAAFDNEQQILTAKQKLASNIVELGRLLMENRDKEYWRALDYDTFPAFLGAVGIAKATGYLAIQIYETYIIGLGMDAEDVTKIGTLKLRTLIPVIGGADGTLAQEWLAKAEALSDSDLRAEVDEARGKKSNIRLAPPKTGRWLMSPEDYVSTVKSSPCCLCGLQKADAHHFPRTKGAGGKTWHVIPLCRRCHSNYHADPKEHLWDNRHALFHWFYQLISGD